MKSQLISEWWAALWPNCFSISIWTVILFVFHHVYMKRYLQRANKNIMENLERNFKDVKTHVTNEHKRISNGN